MDLPPKRLASFFATLTHNLLFTGISQAELRAISIYEAIRDSVPWEVTAIRTKNAISIHCVYQIN